MTPQNIHKNLTPPQKKKNIHFSETPKMDQAYVYMGFSVYPHPPGAKSSSFRVHVWNVVDNIAVYY